MNDQLAVEEMTFSNDSSVPRQPSWWSDMRRRYFPKRYLVSWILAALLPFILLRLLFVSEVTFPFSQISLHAEGNVSEGRSPINFASSPAPGPDVKAKITPESPPFIRPDEDAWITHDDWINHNLNPPDENRKDDHKVFGNEIENSTEFKESFSKTTENGLPEDNDEEERELEATEVSEKDEQKKDKDQPEALDRSQNTGEKSQQEMSEDEGRIKNEEGKPLEGEEENSQKQKSQAEEKIKDEKDKQLEASAENAQQGKSEEEKINEKEEKQTEDSRNFEGDRPETDASQEKEADATRSVGQEDGSTIVEHSDVAPGTNSEEEQKGRGDEKAVPDQQDAREQNPPEEKLQGEKHQEPEETKPLEEQHEPEEQVDKTEEKLHQESEQTDVETPAGECDLFEGEWEHDPEGPMYTNSTCFYMQEAQDCMSNGRLDTDYLYWKWKPRGCDLPRFDAKSFLDSFRGKAIGFVGDSIARNQMQSLLCMLSQVEIPVPTYISADDKTRRWFYREYQVLLAVVWSPYLLKEAKGGVMGFKEGQSVLYLDVLDTAWTSVMDDFDVMVLLTGQWYYKPSVYVQKEEVVGCHYCPELNLTEISFFQAYKLGMRQVLEKVSNEFKGISIVSTFPLSHFENGTWDTGGYCKREQPLQLLQGKQFPGEHNEFRNVFVQEFNDVVRENREMNKDTRLEILDVTKVSLQRVDGHPGPYRRRHPEQGRDPNVYYPNDCLHWCLPGPIEAWNQLVVKIVEKYL